MSLSVGENRNAAERPVESAGRIAGLLPTLAWLALGYNVLVILWGAFVRVSGSGAGCGEHWPLCNGTVLPQSPTLHTIIEFSHRLTGGLSGLFAILLIVLALLKSPRGHPARLGALLTFGLILFEGVVGGVQVLLGLTADSTDPARGLVQGVHLASTFLLLGTLLLTALWASGAPRLRLRGQGVLLPASALGLGLMLVLGMAGAVTALGDLLFYPAGSTPLETVRRDWGGTAGLIQNLRVVHPAMAIIVCAYLVWLAGWAVSRRPLNISGRALTPQTWRYALYAVITAQIAVGLLNIVFRAPGWIQILHLALACLMWLVTVMLCACALWARPHAQPAPLGQPAVNA